MSRMLGTIELIQTLRNQYEDGQWTVDIRAAVSMVEADRAAAREELLSCLRAVMDDEIVTSHMEVNLAERINAVLEVYA
jgi:hypothetical protein